MNYYDGYVMFVTKSYVASQTICSGMVKLETSSIMGSAAKILGLIPGIGSLLENITSGIAEKKEEV